jgi:hypothetical protein
MNRRTFGLAATLATMALPLPTLAEPIRATLYKNPQCSCCEGYAAYLRQNGFAVDVKPTNDLAEISSKAGVPEKFQGCHTMFLDGYVVDGHVPVNTIRHAIRIAGHDRPQGRSVHGLRRHEGRRSTQGLRHGMKIDMTA